MREGFFAAESLDVAVAQAKSSTTQIRGLLDGECELAHTAADNVMAHVDAGRTDLVLVLVAELGIGQKLIARADVASIASLAGRTVGVDSETSGYALVLYRMLADAGLARDDYRVLAVGGTAQRAAALDDGRIDAALLGLPFDERAAAAGHRVLAAAAASFPGYPAVSVAARRTWAREHADAARRYCRALLAGLRWAAEPRNRDAAIELLGADAACDRASATTLYESERAQRERVAPTVGEMREALSRVVALRRTLTGRGPVDLDRYFDPSYALAADPSLAG